MRGSRKKKPPKLDSFRVDALPLINHFLGRLRLRETLEASLPTAHRHRQLPSTDAIMLLVRNLLLCREPLYGVGAWACRFSPALLELDEGAMAALNDDRIGRALDDLFDSQRPSLVLRVVVRAVEQFRLRLGRIHNDSTTVTFHGAYRKADGRLVRGKPTIRIEFGHNKDHRADLKQLLWSLSVSSDGFVPVDYQALDGATTDDQTHRATWDVVRSIAGKPDFLYVADSKLCTRANMRHIAGRGGRFLTVLPATRKEEKRFKDWMQGHEVPWQEVFRRVTSRGKRRPPEILRAYEDPTGSSEGYRIVWYHSSEKEKRDRQEREDKIDTAVRECEALKDRLASPRSRLRRHDKVEKAVEKILASSGASRWLVVQVARKDEVRFRQTTRGRPGPKTPYRRQVRRRFDIGWRLRQQNVAYDVQTDGIFPLIMNDRKLSCGEMLKAYTLGQPMVEQRHHHLKAAHEVAPQYLKSVSRIEAFLCVYFFVLLVNALIEREMRKAMKRRALPAVHLYPENRPCKRPTTQHILRAFDGLMVHRLHDEATGGYIYRPKLTRIQKQIVDLLAIAPKAYRSRLI